MAQMHLLADCNINDSAQEPDHQQWSYELFILQKLSNVCISAAKKRILLSGCVFSNGNIWSALFSL